MLSDFYTGVNRPIRCFSEGCLPGAYSFCLSLLAVGGLPI
jgi:hypothetical protein